ncbi:hypothetical protein [Thalassolituus hydrocarboniclasticus]|uniref:GGDEF domain-containing protein n=1 Tax=Thalassolituus hydrocarboniclasticus TaxID=2742796 RepID=A0ABY6A8D2_9GAMM|nr:hypothetical protein [Thalassolituus hydrocarboniclasticus]UXD86594.1 hypothetical protein HUF19_03650 [Thalassolituus hydrocarboniclasticus]
MAMSAEPSAPSPLQVLARVNRALEDAGLSETRAQREPLPLFSELLNDWFVCQNLNEQQLEWSVALPLLLHTMTAVELSESIRTVFEETLQLSRAHGTLSVWTHRDLENRFRSLLNDIEQESQRLQLPSGY